MRTQAKATKNCAGASRRASLYRPRSFQPQLPVCARTQKRVQRAKTLYSFPTNEYHLPFCMFTQCSLILIAENTKIFLNNKQNNTLSPTPRNNIATAAIHSSCCCGRWWWWWCGGVFTTKTISRTHSAKRLYMLRNHQSLVCYAWKHSWTAMR